jgi:molybdopterin-guanine dinucleotide biosynthesis protein A
MLPLQVPIVGVLLAGGQARRMGGGDKCLRELAGRRLIDILIERVRPQVSNLIINANGDPKRFEGQGLEIVADTIEGYAGPLAGVLTGLEWATKNVPDVSWVASFATDAPFIPKNMVLRLSQAINDNDADMACAMTNDRTHPVFALWPVKLMQELRHAMVEEEMRKIDQWTSRYKITHVDFPSEPVDPFFNVNRPEDLALAESIFKENAS